MQTNRGASLLPCEQVEKRPTESRRRPKSRTSLARLLVRAGASPLRVATDGHASRGLGDSWPSLARPHEQHGASMGSREVRTKNMDNKVSALYRVYSVSTVPVRSKEI